MSVDGTGGNRVRLGIIGLGAMGHPHVGFALNIPEVELTAICDKDPVKLDNVRHDYYGARYSGPSHKVSSSAYPLLPGPGCGDGPACFTDAIQMLDSGLVDAVVVAIPHFGHEPVSIAALRRGIHVLCEKPLAVTVQAARRMLAEWETAREKKPGLVFAEMFMQRTYGHWRKIKQLIAEGELGQLKRTTWIVTDWFRTQRYYDSGGWRATWNGEGGGILVNQAPHNLDLLQWFLGMPASLSATGGFGKHHRIEVEDEVSAILRYADGSVAHFIASTGESPGTNRLEIVGDKGSLTFEGGHLLFRRNRESVRATSDTTEELYRGPECWETIPPYGHHGESGHRLLIRDFARAVLHGEPPEVPATEGINQVMLTNAMMVSLLEDGAVVDISRAEAFAARLETLQSEEKYP